ncbi:uncharacterized protein BYT42DRAFT_564708 [Radiomyces spectabilis]|uniref:uncharacterized protein n=1 Tax=Radiomyces spectabilis TaxID=64574 RepID=UPI00221F35B8|nr:uncharacterized protein BYT42DRAFT_564708 [Radiomyces spectabilis]KAI8380932.1 hypothetical protein BYT42DRAFT_564708 [Radiomyces spectabilis]
MQPFQLSMTDYYIARTVAVASTGILTGFGWTLNTVTVPAIQATSDPVPAFVRTYKNASKFAVSHIIIAAVSNGLCYYQNRQSRYFYGMIFSAALVPFTILFIKPINDQLFALEGKENYDRKKAYQLVQRWNKLQWFRTLSSTVAFVFTHM